MSAAAGRKRPAVGERFGRLVVVSDSAKDPVKCTFRCDCGVVKDINFYNVLAGDAMSCGCLRKEVTSERTITHGRYRKGLYYTWRNMLGRCLNPKLPKFKDYGARGITVCPRWVNFKDFEDDVTAEIGPRPDGCSLDRRNNDGNYEPGNIRWATPAEQCENTRRAHKLEFAGKSQSLSAWAREVGVDRRTILKRLQAGWSVEQALTLKPAGPESKKLLDGN